MKTFITALFLAATLVAKAQIVTIPDANFKAALIRLGIDANSDGEIQQAEADAVTSISILTSWNLPVSDLTGIRSFTNLQAFSCTQNPLTTLDVSGLTRLESLNCPSNQITSLNISGCNKLKTLDCSDNNIKAVNLDNHPNIQSVKLSYDRFFDISDSVHIRLNASNCPRLKTVDLHTNPIGIISGPNIINLVNCDSLTTLYLFGFLVDTLDISQSDGLKQLGTFRGITSLIAKNCLSLTHIYSDATQYAGIADADVTGCVKLESISFGETGLVQKLDLSTCPSIKMVSIPYTSVSTFYLNCKNGTRIDSFCILIVPPNNSVRPSVVVCADDFEVDSVTQWLDARNSNNPPVITINSYCSFYPGGAYNTINGKLRIDDDNNGCNNSGRGLSNVPLRFTDTTGQSVITYSGIDGNYAAYTYKGLFNFAPYFPYPFFTFSPINPVVSFDTANNLVNTTNFCLQPTGVHNDLEISFLPKWAARPGFDALYTLVYKNRGTTALSGTVALNFDNNKINFVTASQNISTQSAGQVTWNYNNLLPFETKSIDVIFNLLPPPVNNIGDTIAYLTSISPSANDETPFDNDFILPQIVRGAFDPNEKQCLEGSKLDISKIGGYLHYLVHFQNEGTDTAFNIVVADTLSDKLDWNSFEFIGSSHTCNPVLKNNKATFYFENVKLPYKTIDEPGSNGWIAFKIKPIPSVVIGDSLNNKAAIYFDFNKPVITNTATTVVSSSSTPVPVKLEYFSANTRNNTNTLNWKAACTYGNANFIIERSDDGIHFSSIGNMTATSVRCQLPFNFTDNNPVAGKNYYRLKITDADGISFYSKTLVLGNDKAGLQITAVANNNIYLYSNKQRSIQLKIIAADGKLVYFDNRTIAAGNNQINLSSRKTAAGIYTLIIYTNDGAIITKRFLK